MTKQLTAVALLTLVAGTAMAAPRESASNAGPVNVWGESVAPESFTMNFNGADGGGAYLATHVIFVATYTSNVAFTWPNDMLVDIVAPDGTAVTSRLSDTQFETPATEAINRTITLPNAANPTAGVWSFTVREDFEDGDGSTPESILTDITVTLDDSPAPTNTSPDQAINLGSVSVGSTVSADAEVSASGTLWYKFTTTADATNAAGHRLVVSTLGSTGGGDSEIGLFSDSGTLVSTNDDDSGLLFSRVVHGANGYTAGEVPAGQYYVAVSSYNANFADAFSVTSTGAGGTFHLDVSLENAQYAPNVAIDLGTLTDGVTVTRTVEVPAGGVVWYKANVAEASNANFRSLTISTLNSSNGGDTMIAIYRDDSTGIVLSDDANGTSFSELVMGFEGFADLTAGTYYIPVSTYPATFYINNFAVESEGEGGTFQLDVTQILHPAPAVWDETNNGGGDSGNLTDSAQSATGSGTLDRITGMFEAADDVDMYRITICDPSSFTASTAGAGLEADTQLFLFNLDGTGVTSDDDDPAGSGTGSVITGTFVPSAGDYYLAISRYNIDPVDSGGQLIWANTPFNAERQPDGDSPSGAVAGWTGASFDTANYIIRFTGTCYVGGNTLCSVADVGAAGGVAGHDRLLNNNDFIAFITLFFANDPQADMGMAGGLPGSDGHWDNNDFIAFIGHFFNDAANCNG